MFLNFIASLILLSFTFQFLIMIIGIPLALVLTLLSRGSNDRYGIWSTMLNQITLSVVYSGFIAIISLLYASHWAVKYPWVYATCGFIATYFTLGSNAHAKLQQANALFSWLTPEEQAAAEGAGIGVLAGLIAYPVFYNIREAAMSWECGCGVVNRDSKIKCSACGTPKGMVWTHHGFKTPDEAAALGDRKQEQGYAGGWLLVAVAIFNIIRAAWTQDPATLLAALLVWGVMGSAAGLRRPWGWYVLVDD